MSLFEQAAFRSGNPARQFSTRTLSGLSWRFQKGYMYSSENHATIFLGCSTWIHSLHKALRDDFFSDIRWPWHPMAAWNTDVVIQWITPSMPTQSPPADSLSFALFFFLGKQRKARCEGKPSWWLNSWWGHWWAVGCHFTQSIQWPATLVFLPS